MATTFSRRRFVEEILPEEEDFRSGRSTRQRTGSSKEDSFPSPLQRAIARRAGFGSIGFREGAGVHHPIGNWRNLVPTLKAGFGPTIFLHLKRAVPTSGSQLHR